MRRRAVIAGLAATAAAWPLAARAETRRVGVLMSLGESDPEGPPRVAGLRAALAELGWTEGRNLRLDVRWVADEGDRFQTSAAELLALSPDVLLVSSTPGVAAVLKQNRAVPVVFVQVGDPVASGFVASLAHPGGTTTGFTLYEAEMSEKWPEILKDIAPQVTRIAVVHEAGSVTAGRYSASVTAAAASLGVEIAFVPVKDAAEIESSIAATVSAPAGGLVVLPGPFTSLHRAAIIAAAARHRLPAVYPFRYFTQGGGLMSYGLDAVDVYRRSAAYVDRILKGAKPADLPVQLPTKFDLSINLKTAKALGLTIPPALFARADEVIE